MGLLLYALSIVLVLLILDEIMYHLGQRKKGRIKTQRELDAEYRKRRWGRAASGY